MSKHTEEILPACSCPVAQKPYFIRWSKWKTEYL